MEAEWRAVTEESVAWQTAGIYIKRMDLMTKEDAQKLITYIETCATDGSGKSQPLSRKTEKKNPPLLYNLAELQNDCSQYV